MLIQSYNPGHYSVACASRHDYEGFYAQELAHRRQLGYPPFSELVRLLFEGRDTAAVERLSRKFTDAVREKTGAEVMGPQPAPVARIRNRLRVHALVMAPDGAATRAAIAELLEKVPLRGGVDLTVDVDPYDCM